MPPDLQSQGHKNKGRETTFLIHLCLLLLLTNFTCYGDKCILIYTPPQPIFPCPVRVDKFLSHPAQMNLSSVFCHFNLQSVLTTEQNDSVSRLAKIETENQEIQ